MNSFIVNNRIIGDNAPCFIVAEISANHNQNLDRAKKIIKAAKEAGADAIKLQTYTRDTLTIDCNNKWFKINSNNSWNGKTLYELYGEAYTPWDWHAELFQTAQDEGLICFSTPFDASAVTLLKTLNAPIYKVASFEIVDLALLKKIAETHKPVIMSTGMASLNEIDEAVKVLRTEGSGPIALLKCTSAYPASPSTMNLKTLPHLKTTFNVIIGLSDHTLGNAASVAAVSLGASIVEKHFTLSRSDGGPDSSFSLEPHEFRNMVKDIREAEQALGKISYERTNEEEQNVNFRRSLFVVADVKKGDTLTEANIRSIRPGQGLHPRYLNSFLGKKTVKDIPKGTPLSWELICT